MMQPKSPALSDGFGGMPAPQPRIGMGQWFTERARRDGGRLALTFEGQTWTYAEMLERIDHMAGALQAGGVELGIRVGYLGFNHPMFFVTLFACSKIGAIFVPLNFRLAGPEFEYIINDAGVHTLLVDADHIPVIDGVRGSLKCSRYLCAHGTPADATRWPDAALAMDAAVPLGEARQPCQDEVAVIMYTSGTTGRPKGAMLTVGNFWWSHVNELVMLDIRADDVLLTFAPIFHIGALNVLTLSSFLKGAHIVLHRNFDPALALRDIARYRVTTIFAVPAMLLFISQHPDFAQSDISSVRSVMCGGAPCPEPLLHALHQRGILVQQGYGLTETSAMATALSAQWAVARIGSVGVSPLLTEVRIVASDGRVVTQPHERGEVCVRGMNVTRGYWNQPEATRNAISDDHWFRTGDVGYFDEHGFYYICDRVKDMVITGGENVYPAEVESVLHAHPSVAEVAVIGAPDPQWGEAVVAVVALRPGTSLALDEMREFASERLARYKVPKQLRIVDALPRNPTGKILKYKLREAAN
ncbi:long-chain fatty acid--CoA ligase [Ramlibacter sp. 2FC]|uniref:acyl-CoA synthetase n=1 Tax=Ramlibacter sp. 2FC TaxID=2502188 RepID=UPI001BB176C9|nr:long-chain fatty acid--CoA ligase [Ramlibacter sp. 2FC]